MPLKPRRFTREYRPLPTRFPALALYASQPDVVAEIQGIAGRLRDIPRPWLDSREDMINALQREGGRLKTLAEQIQVIEPVAAGKRIAAGKLARIVTKPARAARQTEGQMSLSL